MRASRGVSLRFGQLRNALPALAPLRQQRRNKPQPRRAFRHASGGLGCTPPGGAAGCAPRGVPRHVQAAASAAEVPESLQQQQQHAAPLERPALLDLAATMTRLLFRGIAAGPAAVSAELADLLEPSVVFVADGVRALADAQGFPAVVAELERAHLEYHRSEHQPVLFAASEASQTAYALVEGRYQDVGALPGHAATFRISRVHHILTLAVARSGRVSRLWLRRQLTEEEKDELLHEPLAAQHPPFPRGGVVLADAAQHELASQIMAQTVRSWWLAWSDKQQQQQQQQHAAAAAQPSSSGGQRPSGPGGPAAAAGGEQQGLPPRSRPRQDPGAVAAQLLAADFKMYDAYGLWPSMRAQGRRHLSKETALRWLQQLSYNYSTRLEVLDVAVADGCLACFTHWRAHLAPKWSGEASDADEAPPLLPPAAAAAAGGRGGAAGGAAGKLQVAPDGSFSVDGLEVDLFNESLQLASVFMFRGPIGTKEAQLFLEWDRQHAAARPPAGSSGGRGGSVHQQQQAAAEQREQQLTELLSWVQASSEQWQASLFQARKLLSRQQAAARASGSSVASAVSGRLIRQLIQQLEEQPPKLIAQLRELEARLADLDAASQQGPQQGQQGPQQGQQGPQQGQQGPQQGQQGGPAGPQQPGGEAASEQAAAGRAAARE